MPITIRLTKSDGQLSDPIRFDRYAYIITRVFKDENHKTMPSNDRLVTIARRLNNRKCRRSRLG